MPKSIKPGGRRRGHQVASRPTPKPSSVGLTVQIVDDGVGLTPRVRAVIQRESNKLRQFYDRIVGIRAVITATNRRLHREVVDYLVRVHIAVPREELVVERQKDANLLTAIQNAFKSAGRAVEDYARRSRAQRSPQHASARGRVARILPSQGYGFLEDPSGEEVYFHRHAVLDGKFDLLEVGSPVRYTVESGDRGPQASTVTVAGPIRRGIVGPRSRARKPRESQP